MNYFIVKKAVIAFVYAVIAYIIYLNGDQILQWFQTSGTEFILLVMMAATLMALFPVIPYPVVGGVLGAVYGPILGTFITWAGSSLASIIMFLFVRYGYQDWGHKALHQHKTVKQVTLLFEKNAFLAILFSRMVFVIPSIVINIYSALSRVSFASYSLASCLGKVPAMLLFALVGNDIVTNPQNLLITLSVYGVFLTVTLILYKRWLRH
jgi:uncharacterized membrane protein YdjX (TVP38/TMEM64 family)